MFISSTAVHLPLLPPHQSLHAAVMPRRRRDQTRAFPDIKIKYIIRLGYLRDRNAAAHSVDGHIF